MTSLRYFCIKVEFYNNMNNRITRIKTNLTLMLIVVSCFSVRSQENTTFFVDGYHGGVYGHYPEQYTAFLVNQLDAHKNWKINLEIEPATWDVVSIYEPRAYTTFKELAEDTSRTCRIEYVNPSFAQSYLYTCYGESAIRQFQYGMRKLKEHFPKMNFLTYSCEEPCFTSCLPTILSSFGFKYASTKNPNTCWGGYFSAYGKDLINWIGPDGESSLLTSPRYASESLDTASTWRTIASDMNIGYVSSALASGVKAPVGMCLQDAGWLGGPWLNNQEKSLKPDSSITTGVKNILWREYFIEYANIIKPETHTFTQEDVKPGLVWGAQILQKISQDVRFAENKILQSEKISAMAAVTTDTYYPSSDFDYAWQNLLLAQHHDCWIVPYNKNKYGETWAHQVSNWTWISNYYSDKAAKAAISNMSDEGENVIVFNTTGKNKKDAVDITFSRGIDGFTLQDSDGNNVPFQMLDGGKRMCFVAETPSFGYSTYSLKNGKAGKFKGAKAYYDRNGRIILTNGKLKIVIDPLRGGTICSLKMEKDGTEYIRKTDHEYFNGLKGYFPDDGIFHNSADSAAEVKIIECGPVRATAKISGKIAGQPFEQIVSIVNGKDIIDCELKIDWKDSPIIGKYNQKDFKFTDREKAFYNDFYKLHLTFPNMADGGVLYKDAPFDVCETKDEDTYFDSWDEIKHNLLLTWVDIEGSDGRSIALFCDHTESYLNGNGYPLGLNVQFIGKALWGKDYTVIGPTKIHYAIVPHKGKWDESSIHSKATDWNEHLVTSYGSKTGKASLIDLNGTGYQLVSSFVKGNDMYVRLFNSEGNDKENTITVNIKHSGASLVELDGRIRKQLAEGKDITLEIPRFGIRTIKLENVK